MRYLLVLISIGAVACGCAGTPEKPQPPGPEKTENGSTEGNGKPVTNEPEKPRPPAPFAATEEQAKRIEELVKKLTNPESKSADREAAHEGLMKIGPVAGGAVLKLLQNSKTAESYYAYVTRIFRLYGKDGARYLLWAQTSPKKEERKASHLVLRALARASVPFVPDADAAKRSKTIEQWRAALAERGLIGEEKSEG